MYKKIYDIIKDTPSANSLWDGAHKIPWNDPAFSARILREHLSQDHHLASRKTQIIDAQVGWIRSNCLDGTAMSILDLGCGPGLYSKPLADNKHHYFGVDFSPASIEYAKSTYGSDYCQFSLGDVTRVEFDGPHDLVMMLYGELNVFSPVDCRRIIRKAYESLTPGGCLLVEFQNPSTVQVMGESPKSWTRAEDGGLFSDEPYVCLTENYWFDDEKVALQCFHVMEHGGLGRTYRSTTVAWSVDEMYGLLTEAGFSEVEQHGNWPAQDDSLLLLSARK